MGDEGFAVLRTRRAIAAHPNDIRTLGVELGELSLLRLIQGTWAVAMLSAGSYADNASAARFISCLVTSSV